MNRRWVCGDVWMDIFPSFDRPQLGLKMALLSDRFDALVDTHFDGKTTELTIWRTITISKDEGPKANDIGPKAKLSVRMDGKSVPFPFPDRPLPNKIRFKHLRIEYIDHSVIAFLRSNQQIWDRIGTKLDLFIDKFDQSIWDVFIRKIWPIVATNIRHLYFPNDNHLDNLHHGISPTILSDLKQLNSIDSGPVLPVRIYGGPTANSSAGQVLSKWFHTPSKNGQPKRLHCNDYSVESNLEWLNDFKEAFLRAISSVSYIIQIDRVGTMPTEPFELVNERTKEKLTLASCFGSGDLLLKRCPITATVQWKNDENCDDKLNTVTFNLFRGNDNLGSLSPPSTEE